ncbi:hypothetical protein [Oceanobacillus sp. J11TS1]|uniref:hypothetical protein n=1 Tax=Oceanobacillus sp. J11TS1 TaxID=2807191 RepID=UPI001B2823A8|nr:hypothetical protein [Oceanobacillus sp. J11TS1]GIO24102.1 hypothetical protein J11TS1_26830 [Oceanobacillus sp. J11TS1]
MTMTVNKRHSLNMERKQKAMLKASRNRTDELLRKASTLGLAEIYIDNHGRIKRKK